MFDILYFQNKDFNCLNVDSLIFKSVAKCVGNRKKIIK